MFDIIFTHNSDPSRTLIVERVMSDRAYMDHVERIESTRPYTFHSVRDSAPFNPQESNR